MKKLLIVAMVTVLALGFMSCKKHKYCQCYANIEGENVSLGEEPPAELSTMTADAIEALDSKYNVYIIESGTCNDKAKEIVGWGQVTCREVNPKYDSSWFTNLFNKNNNNNHKN